MTLVMRGGRLVDTATGQAVSSGTITDVSGLTGTLADPQTPMTHTHPQSDVTDLAATLNGKAAAGHTHAISCVTNLQETLDGKAAAGHVHAISCVTGLQATLDGKAAAGHTHTISCVTSLQATLDGKAAAGHTHDAACLVSGTIATGRLGSGTADSSTFLRGDQTWAAPSGGADPWTYVRLASDFPTTSATAVDSGLAFTPSANTRYEFEAMLMLRTATATVNPRAGLAWPTGGTDGVAMISEAQTATGAPISANGNINAALLVAVGGLPNTTQSWPAWVEGMFIAGASPSGNVRVQLASETAGTTVRIVAGSYLKYRTVP